MAPINTAGDTGPIAAAQAQAEANAGRWMTYYEGHPGVPADTAGHDPQPLALTEDPSITGTPWDQQ